MDKARLCEIIGRFSELQVAVIGDFFLDRYLVIDSTLAEVSVETGLTVHQVVGKRLSPGAAGTVVSNLRALGVGKVLCLGVIGLDGEGFELKRHLEAIGADYGGLIESDERFTPCYTKPMLLEEGKERELERIDIKNRAPLPQHIELELVELLNDLLPNMDAVLVGDQVQERNYGVVTDRVREAICHLAGQFPEKVFLADSRVRIGEYWNVHLKPNKFEATDAVLGNTRPDTARGVDVTIDQARECAHELRKRTGRAVFLTAQEQGIFVIDEYETHVPTFAPGGPIDPVGAGDSCAAAIASAMAAGATTNEAAFLGNVVASITIQKIGVTGTASPSEIEARLDEINARRTK
jgi:rfaE bifunctional protein kinase chain/domain